MSIGSAVSTRLTVVPSRHTQTNRAISVASGCIFTLCACGLKIYTVASRANLRGPSNQRVMWLRTYLFNHYNISFLAIFHSSSSSQILDFSLICLPFASDHRLYAFTPKRLFISFNFNFWFSFQGLFVSSLREHCNLLYIPCQRENFQFSHILVYRIIVRCYNTNSTTIA